MAGFARTLCEIAVASSLLALAVPGVLDQPSRPQPGLTLSELAPQEPARTPASTVELGTDLAALRDPVEDSGRRDAMVSTATVPPAIRPVRPRMPVGCERVVSPLVRSAAAFQASRCVT